MPGKRILVAAPVAFAASRQKLRGIYRYAANKRDWDIVLVRTSDSLTPRLAADCRNGAFDGIILSSPDALRDTTAIARAAAPVVMMEAAADTQESAPGVRGVLHADNEAIGKMAARYLCGLGNFQSYAFVPDGNAPNWSVGRARGYANTLAERDRTPAVYAPERESLGQFLRRLKKPAAVFAAWDEIAADVIRTCHDNGLDVPADVAVLGVDDDDLICESTRPALSSILVDRIKMGYRAGEILDALMRRTRTLPVPTPCGPLRVVSRESTQNLSSATALAKRAAIYIKENAALGLTPAELARRLRVSRRLLDLRFREAYGTTPAEAIRAQKIVRVKRLLQSSALSDARIAACCGFRNVNALRNLFRQKTGMSMRTFAAMNRRRSPKAAHAPASVSRVAQATKNRT